MSTTFLETFALPVILATVEILGLAWLASTLAGWVAATARGPSVAGGTARRVLPLRHDGHRRGAGSRRPVGRRG